MQRTAVQAVGNRYYANYNGEPADRPLSYVSGAVLHRQLRDHCGPLSSI